MFLVEAEVPSAIGHANTGQVHALGQEGDHDFMVMEYINRKPLSHIPHGRLYGRPAAADRAPDVAAILALGRLQ